MRIFLGFIIGCLIIVIGISIASNGDNAKLKGSDSEYIRSKGDFEVLMIRNTESARGIEIYSQMVDSCKYMVFIYSSYGAGGCHAGDCPNSIHRIQNENLSFENSRPFTLDPDDEY